MEKNRYQTKKINYSETPRNKKKAVRRPTSTYTASQNYLFEYPESSQPSTYSKPGGSDVSNPVKRQVSEFLEGEENTFFLTSGTPTSGIHNLKRPKAFRGNPQEYINDCENRVGYYTGIDPNSLGGYLGNKGHPGTCRFSGKTYTRGVRKKKAPATLTRPDQIEQLEQEATEADVEHLKALSGNAAAAVVYKRTEKETVNPETLKEDLNPQLIRNLSCLSERLRSRLPTEQPMSLATDFGPDSGGRMKGVCIVKPIVYGNIARYFGKKREEDGHTHQWTVYVKPYNNEDMAHYIKKVHFKLHESYANPNRIVVKPPYEISETGWGEFEIVIKIHFHDPNERAVTMYHILKLFHSEGVTMEINTDQGKALISEYYDEIVFQDPTQLMHHLLTSSKPLTSGRWEHNTNFDEKKEKTLKHILEVKKKVRQEIITLKNRLKLAKETISSFKEEIAKVQENQYV